jgi:hypothetical protein
MRHCLDGSLPTASVRFPAKLSVAQLSQSIVAQLSQLLQTHFGAVLGLGDCRATIGTILRQ